MQSIYETVIPKKIHYCWFGENAHSQLVENCLKSWAKYMPDYEIIKWNEKNFDINICKYTRQAYESGKYAFVSDYARLSILYNHGGIYLDCDVEILKPLDFLMMNEAFTGFETRNLLAAWIIASKAGHSLIKEFLDYYDGRSFIKEDEKYDLTPNTNNITTICTRYGLKSNNQLQLVRGLTVYPMTYFCPWKPNEKKHSFTENTYTIHHFEGSWLTIEQKKMRKSPFWPVAHELGKLALKILGSKKYMKLKELMKI